MLPRIQSLPVPGLIFSILGLVYSLIMSFGIGDDIFCLTSGCSIVNGFTVLGLSPWWISAAMFLLIAICCFMRLRTFAYSLASAFVLGDCLFLLTMFFIAPCTSCLGVALLIFCTWAVLRRRWNSLVMPRMIMAGTLSFVWFLLFIVNVGFAISELASEYPTLVNKESKVRIYFSPDCPACLEAVKVFEGKASFYAIAKSEFDIRQVSYIEDHLNNGETLASTMLDLQKLNAQKKFEVPSKGIVAEAVLGFKLMRNRAQLIKAGYQTVPVIMIEGIPTAWVEAHNKAIDDDKDFGEPILPPQGATQNQLPPGIGHENTVDTAAATATNAAPESISGQDFTDATDSAGSDSGNSAGDNSTASTGSEADTATATSENSATEVKPLTPMPSASDLENLFPVNMNDSAMCSQTEDCNEKQ